MKRLVPILLFFGLLASVFAVPAFVTRASGPTGTWSVTGDLNTPRIAHTATLLPNGTVLIAGGQNQANSPASAELYDPTSGTFTYTGAPIGNLEYPTATLLPTGKVLLAGGFLLGSGTTVNSAELYDPATETWTPTGSMNDARSAATATLLPSGKVLVAGGGRGGGIYFSSAELYDPAAGTWTYTGSMITPRAFHTATLLPNGKVLVTGGDNAVSNQIASAELYDPTTGIWSSAGNMSVPRVYHTATLLNTGKVLVAGGQSAGSSPETAVAELYDPTTNSWSLTGSMNLARDFHTATLLNNGEVLVVGGEAPSGTATGPTPLAELYDPVAGSWSRTSDSMARANQTATLLPSGTVLIAGGGPGNLTCCNPTAQLFSLSIPSTPVVGALPNATLQEGSAYTASGSFTDASASSWTATVDYGDGSGVQSLPLSGTSFALGHVYVEEGTYTVTVTVTDNFDASGTGTATVTVTDAALTASCAAAPTSPLSFTGAMASFSDAASPSGTLTDFTASISWGDASSSAGTVSGLSGGPYMVSGAHTYASTGYYTITTTITDVGGNTASTACQTLVFAFAPGGGSFVIGDGNSAIGSAIIFWGAQWSKQNSLSGGAAPASFKGFADSPATPGCGSNWSAGPGNSTPPPAGPLPAYMAVIVTSSVTKSGPTISGDTVHIVIVQTNPGYAPDPGHAGTGTVVAVIC